MTPTPTRTAIIAGLLVLLSGCATIVPAWSDCKLASCWDGSNAQRRMMNMLSPHMTRDTFRDYLRWQKKDRKCNTVHLILSNKADGEYAGYSIYGSEFDWGIDNNYVRIFRDRILECRKAGMAVVLWLMTDDSAAWNQAALSDPGRYLRDLEKEGLLRYASTVVVGLELSEYASAAQVAALVAATRKVYKGKIGVHHNSRRLDFAGLADVLFYQIDPGGSAATVKAETKRALATGKPVNFFEMARNPNRAACEAALDAGAFGVGNW